MSGKGGKSKKKPVETTLGKAPSQNDIDVAHLRKPIDTSVQNVRHVVSLLQTATLEVKNYITYECDIIYECKTCRTIFRSLANFILHKRTYCIEKYSAFICKNNVDENKNVGEENPEIVAELELCNKKSLSPIIKKLHDKQKIKELAQAALEEDLTDKIDTVQEKCEDLSKQTMLLEPIGTTDNAVFQTMIKQEIQHEDSISNNENMKSEVMELHGIEDSDKVALNEDGTICPFKTDKLQSKIRRRDFTCVKCNQKFSTNKTLSYHVKYKHNRSRMVFVCPDCKLTFATAWGVYRHLYKVHRKTAAQVRRMRDLIHSNVVRRDHEPTRKRAKSVEKTDEENQWLNNFEGDNDLQMCGGCGKRFERKAALNSHSTMCLKRIAVCNTIKENNKRKENGQEKDSKAKKAEKAATSAKGSARRKPYHLRTYRPNEFKMPEIKLEVDADDKSVDINLNKLRRRSSSDDQPPCIVDNQMESKVVIDKNNGSLHKTSTEKPNKKKTDLLPRRRSARHDKTIETGFVGFGVNESKEAQVYNSLLQESVEIKKEIIEFETGEETTDLITDVEVKPDPLVTVKIENLDEDESSSKTIYKSLSETNMLDDYEIIDLSSTIARTSKTIKYSKKREPHRRRTSLFEIAQEMQKTTNLSTEENDTFISKAAPYMDKQKLCCTPCGLIFPSYSELLWHMSTHFSWFRFQCSRCTFVSFSKDDCAEHALIKHGIHHSLIPSVVLPIPNWKSVLMSHDFTSLQNNVELRGKLTDEVIVLSSEEVGRDVELECKSDDGKQPVPNLFCDYSTNEFPLDNIKLNADIKIEHEIIDITDDNNDSFQIEMPQEIYTVNETVLCDNFEPRCPSEPMIEDDESFLPQITIPTIIDIPEHIEIKPEIKEEPTTKTCDMLFAPKLPLRSARNRTRSIKTLQADFLYDLTKVLKLNDAARGSRSRKRKVKSPDGSFSSNTVKNP